MSMDGRRFKSLLLGLLVGMPLLAAAAGGRDIAAMPPRHDPNSNRVNLNVQLSNVGGPQLKSELLEQSLLITDSRLTWPTLPRAWVEYASVDYISTNTLVGFKFNPSIFGISASIATRLAFDFRYQIKSSFVLLVSRDQKNTSMYRHDPAQMKTYPNATDERPMIGLCIYESQFTFDRGENLNLELVGNSQTVQKGRIDQVTSTHFSQFFQIDPSMSIDQYQHVCKTTYRERLENEVTADFSRQIMYHVFNNHPQSQCRPEANPKPGESDASCSSWFATSVPDNLKAFTVARCELRTGGVHRCVMKAKRADVSCPLYFNKEKGVVAERETLRDQPVTNTSWGYPSVPCDKASGLTCRVERQPWMLGHAAIRNGEGRCR